MNLNSLDLIKRNRKTTSKKSHEIKLLNGVHNPSEVREIISKIINGQINFYKLQYLAQWEANHATGTDFRDAKIDELLEQKNKLQALMELAKAAGCHLSLEGTIEVKLTESKLNGSR